MEILIDFSQPRGTIKTIKLNNGETWALFGECNRCGQCCEAKMPIKEFQKEDGTCKHAIYETLNGEKVVRCNIIWNRPAFCLFYPRNPYDKLYEKCGFRWERIS